MAKETLSFDNIYPPRPKKLDFKGNEKFEIDTGSFIIKPKCSSGFLQIFVKFSDCKEGFHLVPGDYPGWGQVGYFPNIADTDECGTKCLSTAGCRSYEYSTTERICNLNTVDAPSQNIYKDYAFCVSGNSSNKN